MYFGRRPLDLCVPTLSRPDVHMVSRRRRLVVRKKPRRLIQQIVQQKVSFQFLWNLRSPSIHTDCRTLCITDTAHNIRINVLKFCGPQPIFLFADRVLSFKLLMSQKKAKALHPYIFAEFSHSNLECRFPAKYLEVHLSQ